MKKTWCEPEIERILFDCEDVITTSGDDHNEGDETDPFG